MYYKILYMVLRVRRDKVWLSALNQKPSTGTGIYVVGYPVAGDTMTCTDWFAGLAVMTDCFKVKSIVEATRRRGT